VPVRRAAPLVLVIAMVAASAALWAGVASAAGPEGGTVVRVAMALKASDGFKVNLENSEDGTLTLELKRGGQGVAYAVPGHATAAGLKARFGKLGLIDVAFTATKVLNSTEPGEGCTGAPRTLREGVFTGTIHFTGERGYARIDASRASGSMSVISQWECPEAEATDPFAPDLGRPALASRAKSDEDDSGVFLAASRRGCSCTFQAGIGHRRGGGLRSIFFGEADEKRGSMKIRRLTEITGPASAFRVDRTAGTAVLRPPSPFSGRATYEKRAHHRGPWRSTIRVPLLGADPIDTGDPGFVAFLAE
jgi:hypothetical protein